MNKLSVALLFLVALTSPVALAQQPSSGAPAEIGHPPPLPGPPPLAEPEGGHTPDTTGNKAPPPASVESKAPDKGYLGAYAPPGTPPTPYSTGPLPTQDTGPGLNVAAPDGIGTKAAKAVPCGTVARETDGFTTCVGIPDAQAAGRRSR
jgi:hypothetical protein